MAKKAAKTKASKLFYSFDGEYIMDELTLKDNLKAGDYANGDIIEIFQKVGEKKVKESQYELV